MQFVKHFLLRAMAIFLVNSVAFGALLFSPLHIVILNAVLPALAFDYLFVGVLSILFAFVVESRLAKAIDHLLGTRNSATDSRGADIAHHLLNAFLLLASAVTLWGSIWTSPNQGDCRVSVSKWPQPSAHCNLDRHLLWDLLFGQGVYACHNPLALTRDANMPARQSCAQICTSSAPFLPWRGCHLPSLACCTAVCCCEAKPAGRRRSLRSTQR